MRTESKTPKFYCGHYTRVHTCTQNTWISKVKIKRVKVTLTHFLRINLDSVSKHFHLVLGTADSETFCFKMSVWLMADVISCSLFPH